MKMENLSAAGTEVPVIHVVGRTPSNSGVAPMVAEVGDIVYYLDEGTNHDAAYLGCTLAMTKALRDNHKQIIITTTSQHVAEQMRGEWKPKELKSYYDAAVSVAKLFDTIEFVWRPKSEY